MRSRIAATVLGVLISAVALAAMQLPLDRGAIDQAIAIGQSRFTGEQTRFHAPYRIAVAKAPVDYVEVVTPFRRVELAAQEHAANGGHGFGEREALALLAEAPEQVDLYVELTFHPLNTYVGVPNFTVTLIRPSTSTRHIDPLGTERVPRFGPRLEGSRLPYLTPGGPPLLGGAQPLLGGTLISHFDGRMLGPRGTYVAVISDAGKEIARGTIDFGSLR